MERAILHSSRSCSWKYFAPCFHIPSKALLTSCIQLDDHYKTLGISKGCTQQEIKEAYIRLTKELHPDKNKTDTVNSRKYERLLKVNEAYVILSKPHLRSAYDTHLGSRFRQHKNSDSDIPPEPQIFRDDSFWEVRKHKQGYRQPEDKYYGIPGIRRRSNAFVLGIIVTVFALATVVHFVIAKVSSAHALNRINTRHQTLSTEYELLREQVKTMSSSARLASMMKKLEAADRADGKE